MGMPVRRVCTRLLPSQTAAILPSWCDKEAAIVLDVQRVGPKHGAGDVTDELVVLQRKDAFGTKHVQGIVSKRSASVTPPGGLNPPSQV